MDGVNRPFEIFRVSVPDGEYSRRADVIEKVHYDDTQTELDALREELETSRVAHHETAKVANALREELADKHEELSAVLGRESLTEQRLTAAEQDLAVANHEIESRISAEVGAIEALQAAEQRNAELVELLRMAWGSADVSAADCRRIDAACAKPTESGASE